jgi:hypothetical protein
VKTVLKETLHFSEKFTGLKTKDDTQCTLYLHENILQRNAPSKGVRGVVHGDVEGC